MGPLGGGPIFPKMDDNDVSPEVLPVYAEEDMKKKFKVHLVISSQMGTFGRFAFCSPN